MNGHLRWHCVAHLTFAPQDVARVSKHMQRQPICVIAQVCSLQPAMHVLDNSESLQAVHLN